MKCPKCEKEMIVGSLAYFHRGNLVWAKNEYFESKIANFFTVKNAIKNGGIHIPVGNGVTSNRTRAWACESCKFVLIDCN